MIKHQNLPKLSALAKATAMALCIGLSASPITNAGEFDTAKVTIFTFAGTSTEKAMRDKDYTGVIDRSQSLVTQFGYHDLVNTCAAYAFDAQYEQASRACDRAVRYQPSPPFGRRSSIKSDRWVAYANRAVIRTFVGDSDGARKDLSIAHKKGGDISALGQNLAVIDSSASPVTVELSAVQ